MSKSANIGAVILAAGSSSRLGRPKQLVTFQDKTLIQHTIDVAKPFNFVPFVVVLGANAGQIRQVTHLKDVTVLNNENWAEGIASSIRLGVTESMKLNEALESILILLSDQPYVSTGLIQELIHTHKNGNHRITVCSYQQNVGVPAVFDKHFFPSLMKLTGDTGAKKIIIQNRKKVEEVSFKNGYFDIDTIEDYEKLQGNVS